MGDSPRTSVLKAFRGGAHGRHMLAGSFGTVQVALKCLGQNRTRSSGDSSMQAFSRALFSPDFFCSSCVSLFTPRLCVGCARVLRGIITVCFFPLTCHSAWG